MTYREELKSVPETKAAFTKYLETENTSKQPKELQPWIPFCEGKCAFCYFPVNCEKQTYSLYLKALKKILHRYSKSRYVKTSTFNEVYIGGGSPSVLAENQITDLLDYCRTNFNLSEDCQTKFTACTTSLSDSKIRLLSNHNVDQLDVGIQSFNEKFRKILTLRDKGKEAKKKLKAIKKEGLGLSIDLLYNLPGQTMEQWEEDLKQALEIEVESVDCYPLDLYTKTTLSKQIATGKLPKLGDCITELQMYLKAYKLFKDNGYFPTCHNRFSKIKEDLQPPSSEVIGTGAGFFMGHIERFHYSDIENVEEYITAVQKETYPLARVTRLSLEDEMRKAAMMIYVRTPVNRREFKKKFGKFPEEAFPEAFEKLQHKGLIVEEKGEIKLSTKGDPWRFNIAWEFFK